VWIDQVEVEAAFFPFMLPSPDITACAGEEFNISVETNLPAVWSTGATGDTLYHTEMLPGLYTYDVTVGQGAMCELMETITVEVLDCNCPGPITATVAVVDDSTCPGTAVCDGEATMTNVDGMAPYSFDWGDPANTNAPGVTDLCAGDYTFVVIDGNGCIDSVDYMIVGPEPAAIFLTATDVSCDGLMDGSIDTNIPTGQDPYQFEWDGMISTQNIANLDTGWHYLLLTDAVGCEYSDSAYVGLAPEQVINLMVPGEICVDADPIIPDPTLFNGAWTGVGVVDAATGLFDPAVAGPGDFVLTYVDDNDCNTVYEVDVTVRAMPVIAISAFPSIGCADLEVELDVVGALLTGDYEWNLGDSTLVNQTPPFSHVYTQEGEYDVSLSITDAFGCQNADTLISAVEVISQPVANFSFSPNTPTDYDNEVEFTDLSVGSTSWMWDFGNGQGSNEQNPSTIYDGPGDYLVSMRIESGSGCADSVSYIIRYRGDVTLYVPSSFTPDGDNLNDYFQVVTSSDIDLFTITIFDRWGTVVFQSNDIEEKWNGGVYGTYATEDHLYYSPDGTYSYVITYNSRFNGSSASTSERIYGTIQILR
jgi:gliding motility-associated-like protein